MKTASLYAITFFAILIALWLAFAAAGTKWAILYALGLVVFSLFLLKKTK